LRDSKEEEHDFPKVSKRGKFGRIKIVNLSIFIFEKVLGKLEGKRWMQFLKIPREVNLNAAKMFNLSTIDFAKLFGKLEEEKYGCIS